MMRQTNRSSDRRGRRRRPPHRQPQQIMTNSTRPTHFGETVSEKANNNKNLIYIYVP